jgi:hypothetical protein
MEPNRRVETSLRRERPRSSAISCGESPTFISFTFLRFSTLVWTLTWSEGCGSTPGAT